ncbi:hypothetical protein X975_17563, partial [Stegodyphus mimosarum]
MNLMLCTQMLLLFLNLSNLFINNLYSCVKKWLFANICHILYCLMHNHNPWESEP